MPAHYLLHERIHIGKGGPIGEGGKSVMANNLVKLLLCPPLSFRVEGHDEEEGMNHSFGLMICASNGDCTPIGKNIQYP